MSERPPPEKNAGQEPPLDTVVATWAAGVKASNSPSARAFRPLSSAERESIVHRVLQRAGEPGQAQRDGAVAPSAPSAAVPGNASKKTAASIPATPPGSTDPGGRTAGREPPPVVRGPWRRVATAVVTVAVLAAALAFLAFRRPSAVATAGFDVWVWGSMMSRDDGDAGTEDEKAPIELTPTTRLRIQVKPKKPVRGAAVLVVFVRDDKARILTLHSDEFEGARSIDVRALEALGQVPNGDAALVVIAGVGLPPDDELIRIAKDPNATIPGATVKRRSVRLKDWGGTQLVPDVGGCAGRVRIPASHDLACEVRGNTKVTLWVDVPAEGAEIKIDGRDVPVRGEAIDGGTRWKVPIPPSATRLSLAVPHRSEWILPLEPALDVPALTRATEAKQNGDLSRAEAELAEAATDPRPEVKLATDRVRARVRWREDRPQEALALLASTAEQAQAHGRISDALDDWHMIAYIEATKIGDLPVADAALAASAPLEMESAQHRADGEYYRGLVAMERGLLGEVQDRMERAQQLTSRLMMPGQTNAGAIEHLAQIYTVWGRYDEARAQLAKLPEPPPDPCSRARAWTSRGWIALGAARDDEARRAAHAVLRSAADLVGSSACGPASWFPWMNLAIAEAALHHPDEAEEDLDKARQASPSNPQLETWANRLLLKIALAGAPERAGRIATELECRAASDPQPEVAFEAALGRARAGHMLGQADAAARGYAEAAARLAAWAQKTPLGEGRMALFEQHEDLFAHWVDFAVRRAEESRDDALALEAASIIRASLSAFVATLLNASEKGALAPSARAPGGARSPRDDGVLALHLHPAVDGWVAVLVPPVGAPTLRRVGHLNPNAPPETLAAAVLAPFRGALLGGRALHVYAHRELAQVAFEMLPFEGATLDRAMDVAYGLGLGPEGIASGAPATPAGGSQCGGKPWVLVVSDPTSNLSAAARTVEVLGRSLDPAAAIVLQHDEATVERVMTEMQAPCVRVLQYDGHAGPGGKDGAQAAMVLSDGSLTATRILQEATRVPEVVVLAACQAARDDGLGVARAFLLRGARQVLAAREKVPDGAAGEWMRALYESSPPHANRPWDLAGALRAASDGRAGGSAAADAGAKGISRIFRVLVP
jgi:tetratricopeptide (TPR) repeat protein